MKRPAGSAAKTRKPSASSQSLTPPPKRQALTTSEDSTGGSPGKSSSVSSMEEIVDRLKNEMQFDESLASMLARSGTAAALLALKDQGYTCSEGDPILVIGVDTTSDAARRYFEGGNYGLLAALPGALLWPGGGAAVLHGGVLPAGVVAGEPHALGNFVVAQHGVRDLSDGLLTVFHVANLEALDMVATAVKTAEQFRRVGPVFGNLITPGGHVDQPALVKVLLLESMAGPPRRYESFNRVP
mmetsp:Transcript_26585/g.52056  ORF Transcript_26585/g.52056 Transcript_26585/m.52056 type:complete len:242 (+) Transcript_26585:99-824(+)|eukprot:CAMPEP_0172691088 /NCGR_PEP_ID=MMETSP1074-20121228/24319_1 /TAXON_ID=2916 /ORGANISM="Ceratium fusus, Strain PA161109" /LENGTH=241 /DNA_ID=CAMNT_0013511111 /DNA_START=83 /DNA_END=808 /DNA_ORIENTATION=-